MKQIQYKIYNPVRNKTYVTRYDADTPTEIVSKITKEFHFEAVGNETGIVYDPEHKWKFDMNEVENPELLEN